MSDNCRVSEALYVGLCGYIGTPTEVTVRREMMDMEEMIMTPVQLYNGMQIMDSGSYREGFRFESSDRDTMLWLTNHKVITDLSQFYVYDMSEHSIILMEDTETPPGFVRLKLLTSPRDRIIESSVVPYNDGLYISCVRWRKIMLTTVIRQKIFNCAKSHGPCANGFIGDIETDYALCFHCSYWSRLTCYWRKRCLHNWPRKHVIDDILRNGCHFVPFAADENELDWRLSFSQAEQKLVYSMNHTQFLCYGLLKIFLKEVINLDIEEPFLCSYFVKTTMFWLIQIEHFTWCPDNLLDCCWKCFKYLLQCVHRGVFPNFFVPQNNMFTSKLSTVKGARARRCLLEKLNMYYEMGVTCLLKSPTVKTMIEPVICNSFVRIEPLLGHIKSAADTDYCIRTEIQGISFLHQNIRNNYLILKLITVLINQSFTDLYETVALQKCTADVLSVTAFINLSTSSSSDSTNKKVYRSDRLTCNLLKLAGRVGDVSCLLYLAMYFYRKCRYGETLHVISLVKSRLTQPYIMYEIVDREKYNECVAGWSLSKRMKKAWVCDVRLKGDFYIKELVLEQIAGKDNGNNFLFISPYVMTDMLSVLSNYRLGNRSQCLQSLTDLQTLLLYDDGRREALEIRDISWQILGICQHVVGDLHGALQSYQESLRQKPWHKIQNATYYRIALVLYQLN